MLIGRKLPILNSVKLLTSFQMLPFNQILEVIFVVSFNHTFCFYISFSTDCGRWKETYLCPTQQTCCLFIKMYCSTVMENTDMCGKQEGLLLQRVLCVCYGQQIKQFYVRRWGGGGGKTWPVFPNKRFLLQLIQRGGMLIWQSHPKASQALTWESKVYPQM